MFNNAGVMTPPAGSKTVQGYELQLGTNCVGPFLFTKLLTPILVATAKVAPPNTVRVIWVSSSAADLVSPPGGIDMDNLDYKVDKPQMGKYGVSKAGNYYHGTEFARRHASDQIVSVVSNPTDTPEEKGCRTLLTAIQALNPGNLWTDLDRNSGGIFLLARKFTTYDAIYGAYTELFAALSPDVNLEKSGAWSESPLTLLPHSRKVIIAELSKSSHGAAFCPFEGISSLGQSQSLRAEQELRKGSGSGVRNRSAHSCNISVSVFHTREAFFSYLKSTSCTISPKTKKGKVADARVCRSKMGVG